MQTLSNANQKVTRQQLAYILGVCEKTARKEYRTIMDCLAITNRTYLTYFDLKNYGLVELNGVK